MGKAAFVHLSDGISRLQIYLRKEDFAALSNDAGGGEVDGWSVFQLLDHGDFIGVEGYLFVTKTGELSVHVKKLQFLSKALLPLPDKMHGVHDPEIRPVSYTHLRAHETPEHLVCRLLLEKKKQTQHST